MCEWILAICMFQKRVLWIPNLFYSFNLNHGFSLLGNLHNVFLANRVIFCVRSITQYNPIMSITPFLLGALSESLPQFAFKKNINFSQCLIVSLNKTGNLLTKKSDQISVRPWDAFGDSFMNAYMIRIVWNFFLNKSIMGKV